MKWVPNNRRYRSGVIIVQNRGQTTEPYIHAGYLVYVDTHDGPHSMSGTTGTRSSGSQKTIADTDINYFNKLRRCECKCEVILPLCIYVDCLLFLSHESP